MISDSSASADADSCCADRSFSGSAENDELDGERLERDWEHALDTASEAVNTNRSTRHLSASDAAAASEHIRAERQWLSGFRSTLRQLFPKRSA
jgi:hypothetical protein